MQQDPVTKLVICNLHCLNHMLDSQEHFVALDVCPARHHSLKIFYPLLSHNCPPHLWAAQALDGHPMMFSLTKDKFTKNGQEKFQFVNKCSFLLLLLLATQYSTPSTDHKSLFRCQLPQAPSHSSMPMSCQETT